MLQLLSDRKLRRQMSATAAAWAAKQYSFDRCSCILQHSIEEALDGPRHRPLQTIMPSSKDAGTSCGGPLPATDPPWEHYSSSVAHYVSHASPYPELDSVLAIAAPLDRLGDRSFRLADPAWPATFRLDRSDYDVAKFCQTERTAELICNTCATDLSHLSVWSRMDFWYAVQRNSIEQ